MERKLFSHAREMKKVRSVIFIFIAASMAHRGATRLGRGYATARVEKARSRAAAEYHWRAAAARR